MDREYGGDFKLYDLDRDLDADKALRGVRGHMEGVQHGLLFDPDRLKREHKDYGLDAHRLPQQLYHDLAVDASSIRRALAVRAQRHIAATPRDASGESDGGMGRVQPP